VLGCGADITYPKEHYGLATRVAGSGAIISEFSPGTPPLPQNFPRRNRVVSGLARGVLVIEATISSGSLITARLAGEQGREVFALPGSIHSPFSKGCHKLLREGAKLVETAQDVIDELRFPRVANSIASAKTTTVDDDLTSEERAVIAALGHAPAAVDALVARSGLGPEVVAAALLALELAGRAAPMPGGFWQQRI